MLALTFVRPMDWAVIHGGKDVENRVWPAPPRILGRWIAIHSGLKWDQDYANMIQRIRAQASRVPEPIPTPWPGGRIIGVAKFFSRSAVVFSLPSTWSN